MRLMSKYRLFAAFSMAFLWVTAHGSEVRNLGLGSSCARTHSEQVKLNLATNLKNISIRYENNVALPCWDYADNRRAYEALVEAVKSLASEESNVRTLVVTGAASPIGNEAYNSRLALRRAEALRDIIANMEGGERLRIHTISLGEDWNSVRKLLEKQYHEKNRDEVLSIVRADIPNDEKERQLQRLDGGRVWRVLVKNFMGPARSVTAVHIVEQDDLVATQELAGLKSTIEPLRVEMMPVAESLPIARKSVAHSAEIIDEESAIAEQPDAAELRKPVMAVRSNLLVPALNVGFEVPIGRNWSVGADYYFPWVWPKKDNKDCFELLAWGIEGRYWFGKNRTVFDRLQGHSLGLYGYMGYFDFERNYHGHQGEFVNVGLDYTYAIAVGKRKSLHFEFSLGVGYIYSQARKYTVIEDHGVLISDKITKKVQFFGPTKANISLVVPIFQKVKPNDKQRGNE